MFLRILSAIAALPMMAILPSDPRIPAASPGGGPKLLPTYVQPIAPGCTPMLYKEEDGSITWVGCPTRLCLRPADGDCGASESSSGLIRSCKCSNTGLVGVLCQGLVLMQDDGTIFDWDCLQQQCANPCARVDAPAVSGGFYVCDC